ncbi:MAG: hypothetical protein QOI97_4912, partial [Pseudomonas sp.]|nr:hypothetical protein [Pseudomonas sp.]
GGTHCGRDPNNGYVRSVPPDNHSTQPVKKHVYTYG